jgi:hypothetical protein
VRRVVADIAKLSVGRGGYYTRELATDHEAYLSGHGESPGGGTAPAPRAWGWTAKGCSAGCAPAATSPPRCRVGWRWPPNRPTGPTTGSASCASTNNAARAGWKPMPTSAPSIGRWCEPWPGSGAPPPGRGSRPASLCSGGAGTSSRVDPGRRAWRQAAAEIEQYRHSYGITDPVRALGPEPADRAQRAARHQARTTIERAHTNQRPTGRTRDAHLTSERTTQRSGRALGRPSAGAASAATSSCPDCAQGGLVPEP